MAIGGPFIRKCVSKVSKMWFTQENRVKMTSFMSSSYIFGLSFGFFLTSIFWPDKHISKIDDIIQNMKDLFFFSNLLTLCFLFLLCFISEKDPLISVKICPIEKRRFLQISQYSN